MATTGHESEAINVQGLKASLQKLKTDHIDGKADKATTLAGYGITDVYTKTEVNGLVDTPHQNYVTVAATSQTTAATDVLPASGQAADTIYRVSNWDGSANSGAGGYDVTKYSEYAWDDVSNPNKYVFLCVKSQIGEVFDISVYNNNAKYADLAAALNGGANIPQSLQKGGMSVKYVSSSDNKYIQARCMAQNFTTDVTQWQKIVDEEELSTVEFNYGDITSSPITMSLGYIKCNKEAGATADLTPVSHSKYKHAVVACAPGDVFYILGKGGNSDRLYCFVTSDNIIIGSPRASANQNQQTYLRVVAPSDAAKIIINDETGNAISYYGEKSSIENSDDEPTAGSDNLVKSNGIVKSLKNIAPSLVLNKFNKDGSNVVLGKYLDYNNGITLLNYATWNTTDFIEVNPNKLYDMVSFRGGVKGNIINGHIYGYDENKNFINISGNGDFGSTQNKTLAEFLQLNPIPSNVKYVRFSFENQDWDYCIFAEKYITDTINAYVSFGTTLFDIINKLQDDDDILFGSVENLSGSVDQIKSSLVLENLFNKDDEDCAIGKYLDYNNGITLVDFATWNTTDFIEVNPNKLYDMVSFRGGVKGNIINGHIYGYDENKNFINISGNGDFGSTQNKTLAEFLQLNPIPSNVKYVRFSFENQDWDYCIFAEKYITDTINAYVSFGIHSVLDEISEQIQQNDIKIVDLQKNAINYDGIVKSINRIADGTPYPLQTVDGYKYVVRTYGYKTLLCDLMFTSDNVPVLSHDLYLNQYYGNVRLLGGGTIPDPSVESNRVYISRTTFQTLYSNYDFGIYKSDKFAGIRIQRFEDFVKMCRMLDCDIYVEVKEATTSQMEIALGIVRKYNMQNKTSWTADFNNTGKSLMRALTSILPTTRVSLMPTANITTSHVDGVAELKTGQNEVFLFGWNTTNLTNQIVSYMIEKGVAFEMGTLNTAQDIINYFARSDAQKYCTGIETQTIIAGKVMYDNNI